MLFRLIWTLLISYTFAIINYDYTRSDTSQSYVNWLQQNECKLENKNQSLIETKGPLSQNQLERNKISILYNPERKTLQEHILNVIKNNATSKKFSFFNDHTISNLKKSKMNVVLNSVII